MGKGSSGWLAEGGVSFINWDERARSNGKGGRRCAGSRVGGLSCCSREVICMPLKLRGYGGMKKRG